MKKEQDIFKQVTDSQLYLMASAEVMDNLPLSNKTFAPEDIDECADKLKILVTTKMLSLDWIKSVAKANMHNAYCVIDLDDKMNWSFLSGLNKVKNTQQEFVDMIRSHRDKMKLKKFVPTDKYGKRYFKED